MENIAARFGRGEGHHEDMPGKWDGGGKLPTKFKSKFILYSRNAGTGME